MSMMHGKTVERKPGRLLEYNKFKATPTRIAHFKSLFRKSLNKKINKRVWLTWKIMEEDGQEDDLAVIESGMAKIAATCDNMGGDGMLELLEKLSRFVYKNVK